MADRVIHFEILGRDQDALQRYYADLFGWQLNTDNPGGYGMTSPDETASWSAWAQPATVRLVT
jgi:predicted enzyme related to lactoylglutathione lyase